ncbi:MAG: hypothetical protein E7065_01020 [Lentimicrobiaceae bacterium]|nr:hypothetical protein [Lentimicrobiaceae bacterium]
MRMLLFYILLALLGQQTTVNGQQTPFLESENLKTSESEKGSEPQAMSNEPFSETEKSVNISEICGNEKTNHKLVQKKSEKSSEQRAMSNESFLESEYLKTLESEKGSEQRAMSNESFLESENLKTSESEKSCEPRAMSNEQKSPNAQSSQLETQSPSQVFSFSDSQILYFENQIRLADSLYKNYLPQYNFEEVKAAVMFFDSLRLTTDNSQRTTDFLESENLKASKSEKSCEQRAMSNEPFLESENLKTSESEKSSEPRAMSHEQKSPNVQSSKLEAQSTSQVFSFSDSQIQNNVDHHELLKFQNSKILEFLRARAHYYHAVGLTERDDIVGACEHYFIALEIMESESENLKTSKSGKGSEQRAMSHEQKFRNAHSSKLEAQSPDYEKIRFLSLIYTRLGELFLSENYCDLAISKYRKALKYKLLLGENKAVANTYKCLGNSYQLYNMPDSALYYYNKSLETNSELPNRLDVEKCIAQILFDRGEKDTAYRLINNNLSKLEGYAAKYSYYQILGEMYHRDNLYDSAIKYLNLSMYATNKHTILTSSNILAAIYDSIGNMNHKFFYDSISISILNSNHNKSIYTAKLQNVYSEYANRKQDREIEKEKIESRKLFIKYLIIALSSILVLVTIIFVLRHRQRKDKKMYDEKIFNMNSEIDEKNVEIENGKKTISVINSELESITKKYDKLSNDYISEKKESEKTLSRKITKNDIRKFCNCENSKRILTNIDDIKNRGLKINNLATLTNEELRQLLDDADTCLYDFSAMITNKYPKLNDVDLYCICLLLLNINGPTIAALLGKDYNSVWSRIKKIYSIIGVNSKENLYKKIY